MMTDKQEEHLMDAIEEGLSNCCGAKIYIGDICSDCKEHCGVQENEEETELLGELD